jgi:glycosyltransferase involved in cell wall biosynthesis
VESLRKAFSIIKDLSIINLKIGVFHPGTQHSWQTALAFQEVGQLSWYATSIFYTPNQWPYKVEKLLPKYLSAKVHREFTRRHSKALNPHLVKQFGVWEWAETAAARSKASRLASWCNWHGNIDFGRRVIRLIEKENVDLIWGFNSSSLEIFRWAKKRGISCILDQTTPHPKTQNSILTAEFQRHPEFFEKSFSLYDQASIDQQNEECALADLIVVGSDFCKKTMIDNGCSPNKIIVVHYGFDECAFPPPVLQSHLSKPIRFLFVGHISARKGMAYLLKAFEGIPADQASLTLVGGRGIPSTVFQRYAKRIQHIESVPRSDVYRYFGDADCFIFPSLLEGSALVLCEACGSGLGIIQSSSGGYGAIPNENGIILDSISIDEIFRSVNRVLQNSDQLTQWRQKSLSLRGHMSWSSYRSNIRQLVSQVAHLN